MKYPAKYATKSTWEEHQSPFKLEYMSTGEYKKQITVLTLFIGMNIMILT